MRFSVDRNENPMEQITLNKNKFYNEENRNNCFNNSVYIL